MAHDIHIIGGGLAGSEAAWQLARRGVKVRLSEMRGGGDMTPAHQTDGLAELVCSNSFRSDDSEKNAVGLLHDEMRRLDSLVMRAGEVARVPAGSAMAVDRDLFSAEVQKALEAHPNIEIVRERIDALPAEGPTIVATGPLTAAALAQSIVGATGADRLAFFDAIAPIVHRDSINMDVCWMASRWDKGSGVEGDGKDYINCPMTREQYLAFHQGLIDGEKGEFKEWEANTPYFDGCMPIEVMAERGVETLRFGPMKPVGLDNPHWATPEHPNGRWPYAVVQ
ncbi:MAG: methylenetetrahydrofolate--tRNA-(uracil(54)-C(5))-methyltransferase (FADH(2)-oxidizing) TrmFO, partial [Croceibacterium sp.]